MPQSPARSAYPPESQPPRAFYPVQPQGFPPPPPPGPWPVPPPGPLPIMEELEWLRSAVESQSRTIKYLLDNYNGLLAKMQAEGLNPAPPSFGPVQPLAVGAIVAPGRWVVVEPGTLSVAATSGQFITVMPVTSVSAAISLMPVS